MAAASAGPAPEKQLEKIHRQARETLGRVEKVNIRDSMRGDAELIRKYFLPGLKFRTDIFIMTLIIVGLAILWFNFFFGHCYENDRCEDLLRWGIDSDAVDEDPILEGVCHVSKLRPDIAIVFPHPDFKSSGMDGQMTHSAMSKALVVEADTWKVVCPDGEVAVRLAPTMDAPRIGRKFTDNIVRGFAEDGWVALASEDGYISIMTEEDGDEFVPSDSRPTPSEEATQTRAPALEALSTAQAQQHQPFRRSRKLMKDAMAYETAMTPLKHLERARGALTGGRSGRDLDEGHARFVPEMPTKAAARVALLQDLYDVLPRWGFDITAFSSVDDDELYVCVSLVNEEAQNSYLLRQNTALAVRRDVVRRLGIDQPANENASSPPRMRFDPRIVKHLHEQGVLPSSDPREMYQCYRGRDPHGCIVSGKDRFRMIFKELCIYLDLDAARYDGLVHDWYPCHSVVWLRRLDASWASFRNLCDLTFVQPICMIMDYFGARLAFIFAWNGLYAKCLLALTILAVSVEIGGQLFKHTHSETPHIHRTVNRRIVLSFSVCVTVWARIARNLWLREEEYFMRLWEIRPDGMQQTVRPSFQGESLPSPADRNLMEKQYPEHMARSRKFTSATITIAICAFVALVMMVWQNMFQDNMNLVASVVLAGLITVFSVIYDMLVPMLVDWENHKFQSQYYDSVLWKQFLFQSVNRYFAFFQLAVKQRYTDAGCPKEGCLQVMRTQLVTTLAILSVTRIFEVIVAALIVRFKIWYEDYNLGSSPSASSAAATGRTTEEADGSHERSFIELQSKFVESRLQEQIQNMLQLVLALGFVLLFGPIAPIIVPFSLAVFMVQLRATAFVLLKYTKRTLPRQQIGIGLWRWIVEVLMQGGILFSGFLIAVYSDTFEEMPMITKMAGVVLYVLCMQLVAFMVDVFVPKSTDEVTTLIDRRRRVKEVIMKRTALIAQPDQGVAHTRAQYKKEVFSGEWSKIPHLASRISEGERSP